jgi:bacillopeptidase F (M6 metalloprotease family)
LTTIKCSICKQEYEQSDFEENHLSTKHGITGPIVEYLVHLEQRIKKLEDDSIDQRLGTGNNKTTSIRKNKSAAKTKKNKTTAEKPKGKRSTKKVKNSNWIR